MKRKAIVDPSNRRIGAQSGLAAREYFWATINEPMTNTPPNNENPVAARAPMKRVMPRELT